MTTTLKSKPLPAWSRALIVFVVLGMIAVFSAVIIGTAILKQQFDLSANPKAISRLARSMILLPDPLPKGYSYFLGMDLFLLKTVTIDYENGSLRQRLVFFSCPTNEKTDAKEMLQQTFEQGIGTITGDAASKFTDVLTEGAWMIRDSEIVYRIGKLDGENAGTGLVACLVDENQKRALIIYGIQPNSETFDIKPCTNLLENADENVAPTQINQTPAPSTQTPPATPVETPAPTDKSPAKAPVETAAPTDKSPAKAPAIP